MPQHTPGPWHLNGYAYKRDDAAPTGRRVHLTSPDSDACEGFTVNAANVQICDIKRHTRRGDARLIASAPTMLKALMALEDGINRHIMEDEWSLESSIAARDVARAAIAAATGEE